MSEIGRVLFLKQLEGMQDDKFVIKKLPKEWEETCSGYASELNVPDNLRDAFNAYCLDYVINENGATHENGAFFNDEDTKAGIYDKLYYFYRPIANRVEEETDAEIWLVIEPNYDDRSHVLAVVTWHGSRELPVPFVAHKESIKTWEPFFDEDTLPDSVCDLIEQVYESMKAKVVAGLRANGVPLPGERPAGIFVRYTGISGEAEFLCATLIPYTGDVPAEEAVRDYFRDFFGKGTEQESDCVYFSPDGGRAVKIGGWTVVPPEDCAVLKKYVR